jgi:hypothetical protein
MILFAEEMSEKIEREGEPEFEQAAAEQAVTVVEGGGVVEGEQAVEVEGQAAIEEVEGASEPVIVDHHPEKEMATSGDFHSLFTPAESGATEQLDASSDEAAAPEEPPADHVSH